MWHKGYPVCFFLHGNYCYENCSSTVNKLLRIISDLEANVMSIDHQRMGTNVLPGQAEIRFSLETKNREHIDQIQHVLIESGYTIHRLD